MGPAEAKVDVAILGGGVAGLWLLTRLRQAGFAAVLLEQSRLGSGQSIAAQGIIHGGLKYASGLKLGRAAEAIGGMPDLWRRCLAGRGEIDLSAVPLLSPHHLLWLPPGLLGRTAGFFASRAVKSRAERLAPERWPTALQGCPSVGAVYALDEPVVDVPALLRVLSAAGASAIRQIKPGDIEIERGPAGGAPGALRLAHPAGGTVRLRAQRFVFTAGIGNEAALAALVPPPVSAQRRPLQMVLVRGVPHPLYAHCFDLSDKPRLTITSHCDASGRLVWYLGGQIAEAGAGLAREALIGRAKAEIAALLPDLAQGGLEWATLGIDRAEAGAAPGLRPDRPVAAASGSAIFAWPTKLAFAPLLAAEVLALLARDGIVPAGGPDGRAALEAWPVPAVALPPWEEATWTR